MTAAVPSSPIRSAPAQRALDLLSPALLALGLFACATPQVETHVIYSDDGQSELSVPAGWASRADLGQVGTLRVGDSIADAYLMVHTYLPSETGRETLAAFAERVSGTLRDAMREGRMSGPRSLTIDGRRALEYEVAGHIGDTGIVYQSTVLEGRRARFHHVIAWTTSERYAASRGLLRGVAATFRESDAPRAAKERVDLTFQWPRRLEARIEYHNRRDKGAETFELRAQGTTSVQPLGREHLLVSTRITGHRATPAAADGNKAEYLQNLLRQAMTDVPDYVVTTDGEFAQVENLGAYHRRIEQALLKGLPPGSAGAQPKAKQLVQTLLSPEVLAASMEDEWNSAVGAWAGGSYVPGETYRFMSQYRAPALGDRLFPMSVTQQLTGRVPCHERTRARSCVRLVQTSRVADPAFTEATDRVVRRSVGGGIEVENVELVKQLVVVTDPATLLPYQVDATETKHIVVQAGGQSRTGREVQESRTVYRYAN